MRRVIIGLVSAVALGLLVLGVVALIASIDLSDPATAAKVMVALIALLGVAFTGTMTLMAAMINRSVQREGQRLAQLQQDAILAQTATTERRLRIEAAVKAVELFGTTTGEGTAQQNTGALFALVTLGYDEFALHLLDQLWPTGKVTRHGAAWVLSQALASERLESQTAAAEILADRAGLLLNESRTDFEWPAAAQVWPAKLPLMARHAVMTGLLRTLITLDPDNIDERAERGIIGLLLDARDSDPHLQVRATATLALSALLEIFTDQDRLTRNDQEPRSIAAEKKRVANDLPQDRLDALHYFVALTRDVETWTAKRRTVLKKLSVNENPKPPERSEPADSASE